uniref:8.9 kDa family member n=1 Tax=Rhipicephalus zambeziensis TaxID=60191 RepID=A0A224YAM8_9ACAR
MGGLVSWFRRDEEVRLENDGTFATENVTVIRGICHFNGRTIIDRHTITMSDPCAEATCWAPLKVVLLTKCPTPELGYGCTLVNGSQAEYPWCCPQAICY